MITVDGKHLQTVTETGIYGFFGDYRFLSNFHETRLIVDGIVFNSSESAYMAQKTTDPEIRKYIAALTGPEAKKFAKTIFLREDWDYYRVLAMDKVVLQKFLQNPGLADMLIKTGDKYLEETNYWNDKFWGVCKGEGLNMLGHVLMHVRQLATSNN